MSTPSTLSPPLSPTNPLSSHPTKPIHGHRRTHSQTHILIPTTSSNISMNQTATRLQCHSNHKLRLESDRNDPRLRRLLGHISIYDNVREYRKEQLCLKATTNTTTGSPGMYPDSGVMAEDVHQSQSQQRRSGKVLFDQRPYESQIEHNKFSSTKEATNELQQYLELSQVTTSTPIRVPSFQDFQAAIEMQLETLSEIQSASRRLQKAQAWGVSRGCDAIDEEGEGEEMEGVEEFDESDETDSEYDSFDGEREGWRDDEEMGDGDSEGDGVDDGDSMTDPESVRSECSSPIEGERREDEGEGEVGDGDGYFGLMPLTPLVGRTVVC